MQVGTDAQEHLSPQGQEDIAEAAPKATGAELFSGNRSLTPNEAMSALEAIREQVIRPAFPEWDARRCHPTCCYKMVLGIICIGICCVRRHVSI